MFPFPGSKGFYGWGMPSVIPPTNEIISVNEILPNQNRNEKYWRIQKCLKDDPAERESHKNIIEHYTQSRNYMFNVKQWLDDSDTKLSVNRISQYALFKCMHPHCIFATDSDDDMIMHMDSHLTFIDVLKAQNSDSLNKTMRDEQIKFRHCCYCDLEANSNRVLINHINDEHSQSIFQCSYCFYRSIEVDSMIQHYESFHPTNKCEILLYGESREFRQQDYEMLIHDIEINVDKIKCGQGKNKSRDQIFLKQ